MLKVKRLNENAILPTKNKGDAGYDLYSLGEVVLAPNATLLVDTGIAVEIPDGYVGLVWPRSGMAVKYGLDTMAGVIDSSYRGELKVLLWNNSDAYMMFKPGTKIAQMVVVQHLDDEVVEVTELTDTSRGENGFGSTGQ
jgi:dUTP pyrophosphatase